MNKLTSLIISVMVSLCFLSASAFALTTPVSNPGGDGVISTLEGVGGILDRLYGWGNLQRIDDDLDHDFLFKAGDYVAVGEAKYAGWTQEFGYSDGITSTSLFSVTKNFDNGVPGKEASHLGYFSLAADSTLKFFDDSSGNPVWTTDPVDNVPGGLDHVVSYRIISGQHKGGLVLAFEDKNLGDWDYNDLVVRINPTPEPGTVMLLGLGLMGLGVVARRRRS